MGVPVIHDVFDFTPADSTANETKALLNLTKGSVVLEVFAEKLVIGAGRTSNTIAIGDGGSTGRFIAAADPETGTAGDIVDRVNDSCPYAYPADDTVDVTYVAGTGTTTTSPTWRVHIIYLLPG